MKKISLILIAIFLPLGAYADVSYDQSVRIFRAGDLPDSGSSQNLEVLCNLALTTLGFPPFDYEGIPEYDFSVATKVSLESVHSKKTTGEFKKPIKKVGEALVCQDWNTWAFESLAAVPVLYVIELNGKRLYAVGGVFSPLFGRLGGGGQPLTPQDEALGLYYPAQGVFAASFSATILPSLPADNGVVPSDGSGGIITTNSLLDTAGLDDEFETEGLWVIRLFDPVDE